MKKISVILLFLVFSNILFAQKKIIDIVHSNYVGVKPDKGPDVKIFVGQVAIQHDSTTMYCDSALYNTAAQTLDAYGNVEIQRLHNWDTIYLFGNTLHYDGETKIAQVREDVELLQDTIRLNTDFLDYDLNQKVGTYRNGGRIIAGQDTLISDVGYFYSDTKDAFFKDNVQVYSSKANVFTDTLKHNVDTRISYLLGPSKIVNDSTFVYAEYGSYDYNEGKAYISKRSKIISGEHSIAADSLFYDRQNGFGFGMGNVEIIDTVQNLILKGNNGKFFEESQMSIMTDSALFMEIEGNDTLWLHSDTLLSYVDTLYDDADTLAFRMVFAYNHVKLYKSDLQVKCDSLVYSQLDSLLMLFGAPVIWSEKSQLNAEYVELYMSNNNPKEMFMYDSAYMSEMVRPENFNIVKGKFVHAWFKNQTVDKVQVLGNIKANYFIIDDSDRSDIGLAVLNCDSMNIFLDSSEIQLLVPFNKPNGKIYPPDQIPADEKSIGGFIWYDTYRPMNKYDIFVWQNKIIASEENNETDKNSETETENQTSEEISNEEEDMNDKLNRN